MIKVRHRSGREVAAVSFGFCRSETLSFLQTWTTGRNMVAAARFLATDDVAATASSTHDLI
jgi:hypothetical protein